MMKTVLVCTAAFGALALVPVKGIVGQQYTVLDGIHQGNLTVFPIVDHGSRDTSEFLTLDEGIRSSAVVVSELGAQGIVRPMDGYAPASAEVNRLALENKSDRPLLLLAGEIVSGGKQDRIVARDRIVPAHSGPIDLGVFCVEPGRWTQVSSNFGSIGGIMVAPSVRGAALADQNQTEVWNEVKEQAQAVAAAPLPKAGPTTGAGRGGGRGGATSYVTAMTAAEAQQKIDSVTVPIERSYGDLLKTLRNNDAVGLVVAVSGRILWADIFASSDLLQRYWEKLLASYAAESVADRSAQFYPANVEAAQAFLADLEGSHETSSTVAGLYRESGGTGPGFTVFHLTSLLPKTGYDLHIAKMTR